LKFHRDVKSEKAEITKQESVEEIKSTWLYYLIIISVHY
jgi:hypothetical protein